MPASLNGLTRFVTEWYAWGVSLGFAITLVATFWIFFDSNRRQASAGLWRTLSLLCALVLVPGVLLSFFPYLATGLGAAPILLAYLGLVACTLALIVLVLYSIGLGVKEPLAEGELLMDPLPDLANFPPVEARPAVRPPDLSARARATPNPAATTGSELTAVMSSAALSVQPLAWLVEMNGPGAGREHRLAELTDIGRSNDRSDIGLEYDLTVSRQHARVRREDGNFVVYDLASANGVLVNGKAVQRQTLRNGDRVVIGQTLLGFMMVSEEQTPGAESAARSEPAARAN